MHSLNNKNKLLELLTQGTTVITPNNRLSSALLQDYFTYCNLKTIDKPICLPFRTMIINSYQQLKFQEPEQPHPTLLNEAQCQHLWRKIIKANTQITYSEGLLKAVMQAWEHCQQWQIHCDNPGFTYTPQMQQFQQWWQMFDNQLKQLHAIAEYQLIPYLLKSPITLSFQSLVWASFDEFNPQQLTLQKYLNRLGITQYTYDLAEQPNTPKLLAAKDTKEEYLQLITWLHLQIEQGNSRIGVVIPDLAQESRTVHRLLHHHFDPALFNISLGKTLNEFPLIAHALTWLNLDTYLNPHQMALLLQSPYNGFAKEEFVARSHYLQESTLLQEPLFSIKTLISDLHSQVPKLADQLKKMNSFPRSASPAKWVEIFHERLNSLGFPGDYGLNSENYQCFNRFSTIFDEFRQFSFIDTQLSKEQALDALSHLIENTIFQAQKTNAPIQISGLLEASGCEFDSLWVMGLTDHCLPQKTRLSAFIPPQLQRELMMPHSVPVRELHFARQTIQRLQRGSRSTVFSYPKLRGDNPNLPSSLVADFPDFEPLSVTNETISNFSLIEMEETYVLMPKLEESVSGGTALLANQAKCPFKAFAEYSLKAKPLLQTNDGLDNKEKGQIIHKVMELIWQVLGGQKTLLNMSSQELDDCIEQAINTTLLPLKQIHPDSFPNLIQEIEYTRLKRLVLSSLEWEKQRPPFSIAAIEQSYSINLAGLDFKVRVDRIDQVDDKKWVIDYKSSLPPSKPWNEDRPKEPQLLLYALLDEEINTLLLMQLKTGNIVCNGLSEEKQTITGITSLKKDETWESSREKWQHQLTLLAQEFQEGYCPPKPASLTLCQQCDFPNLCRFQPEK